MELTTCKSVWLLGMSQHEISMYEAISQQYVDGCSILGHRESL
jgi:hypothetical protein